MSEEHYLAAPDACKKVAMRMLKQALEAAEKGEWDDARYYASDAAIWMEGIR